MWLDSRARFAPRPRLWIAVIVCSAVACGGEGRVAQVSVVISGLTKKSNAASFVLDPGVYDFLASGVADVDSADITLTVRDKLAEVASLELSLPLLEANAAPGDVGSGANTGVVVGQGEQSVVINIYWQEGSQQP